jgi:hypothetical protein
MSYTLMQKWKVTDRRPPVRVSVVEAALWYEAKEKASRLFQCSPMDLDAEPVEKVDEAP